MSPGRQASMPEAGYEPPQRLFLEEDHCVVRFVAEQDRESRDFDFMKFGLARPLRESFARAFDAHTGPAGQIKSMGAAGNCYRQVGYFIDVLTAEENPPTTPAELRPRHVDAFALKKADLATAGMVIGLLRSLMVNMEGLTPEFAAKCTGWVPSRRERLVSRGSYSAAEEKTILDIARDTVRTAAKRIRASKEVLDRWRAGHISQTEDPDTYEYATLLDMAERTGELPRNAKGNGLAPWAVRHGTVVSLTSAVHLTRAEVCAITLLLVRLTGENGSTIIMAPAAHHRTDGGAGPVATAQVDLSKPRRGRLRYMTAALSNLPTWASAPGEEGELSARDELHTPFGLYMLAWDLASSARRIMGSDRLLVYWVPKAGGTGVAKDTTRKRRNKPGRGFRDRLPDSAVGEWGASFGLRAEEMGEDEEGKPIPIPLIVGVGRMRVTHGAREQKPVAHSKQTLADTYLRRDRSSTREYQKLVADVLEKEVIKAQTVGGIRRLSEADLADAAKDLEKTAKRFGVTPAMMRLLIARDADTVLAACTDNLASDHSPPGEPCRASFLKCLDCGCARAMPHHLPVQIAARDMIAERRTQMTALRWAERFASPFHQLEDLLEKTGDAAVARARTKITDADRELVRRLLEGELDQR
ncbi:hypothetical protein ACFWBC_06365 [Streptomyces sp. NPDC059985]|uniref:hypothetical protein n=1 Tax=Streptomyces sp. NPDC059985 TaxID=3347025 RepID=UPI003697F9B1